MVDGSKLICDKCKGLIMSSVIQTLRSWMADDRNSRQYHQTFFGNHYCPSCVDIMIKEWNANQRMKPS